MKYRVYWLRTPLRRDDLRFEHLTSRGKFHSTHPSIKVRFHQIAGVMLARNSTCNLGFFPQIPLLGLQQFDPEASISFNNPVIHWIWLQLRHCNVIINAFSQCRILSIHESDAKQAIKATATDLLRDAWQSH